MVSEVIRRPTPRGNRSGAIIEWPTMRRGGDSTPDARMSEKGASSPDTKVVVPQERVLLRSIWLTGHFWPAPVVLHQ